MQSTDIEDAERAAKRVPGWSGRPVSIEPLDGGITNRNYVVSVSGLAPETDQPRRFVLRLFGKDTELLGIDRVVERDAARAAATLGIGPEVVAFLEPEGFLVTEFLDAAAVPDLMVDDVIEQIGRHVRTVHTSGPLVGSFDCFGIATQYAHVAKERGVPIPSELSGALAIAAKIETAFASRAEPSVLCHNDLLNANFLRGTTGRVWLIDWEYAGVNNRWFDLGNLATNNELDPHGRERLLKSYAGTITPGGLARIELMQVMSDLREAMWAVVQQGISQLDFDYVGYAQRHFDRLFTNASTPAFGRALIDATKD